MASSDRLSQLPRSSVERLCGAQVIVDLRCCVRELVENALDAGATEISVRLRSLGSSLPSVEVADNGGGVSAANFAALCLPHSTSKLGDNADSDDLFCGGVENSFGFRGEALASLCAISEELVVTTRTSDVAVAAVLHFDAHGTLKDAAAVARPVGTTVEVRGFLSRLPVRLAEFRSSGNAKRQVLSVVSLLQQFAVSRPHVRLELLHEAKQIFLSLGGFEDALQAAVAVGGLCRADFAPIVAEDCSAGWRLAGWISAVGKVDHFQMFFLNNKPVDLNRPLLRHLNGLYKKIGNHHNPQFILFLTLDRHSLDLNVTPDKRTVFLPNDIQTQLVKAVDQRVRALLAGKATAGPADPAAAVAAAEPAPAARRLSDVSAGQAASSGPLLGQWATVPAAAVAPPTVGTVVSVSGATVRRIGAPAPVAAPAPAAFVIPTTGPTVRRLACIVSQPAIDTAPVAVKTTTSTSGGMTVRRIPAPAVPAVAVEPAPKVRKQTATAGSRRPLPPGGASVTICREEIGSMAVVGQFNRGFIVSSIRRGEVTEVYVVDQHAADEKSKFEWLSGNAKIEEQRLVVKKSLRLSAVQEEVVRQRPELWRANGFGVEVDEDAEIGRKIKICGFPCLKGLGVERSGAFGVEDFMELLSLAEDGCSGWEEEDAEGELWGIESEVLRPKKIWRHLASRACRTAIMIGDILKTSQMKKVLEALGGLKQPWHCPHGRPTIKLVGSVENIGSKKKDVLLSRETLDRLYS